MPAGPRELHSTARRLLERHGGLIMTTARRYAATPEDAEDAFQRAFEILLTKAPTTREQELVPWLRTVAKHEAFALRRQRERHTPPSDDGQPRDPSGTVATAHERAERHDLLRRGAEALRRLKPQEARCLLLRAHGYSYVEICSLTGWTYTKVNRSITEGRRAFLRHLTSIEAGSECERLAALLPLLAHGEGSTDDLAAVRPHLTSCLSCRARLREYRASSSASA